MYMHRISCLRCSLGDKAQVADGGAGCDDISVVFLKQTMGTGEIATTHALHQSVPFKFRVSCDEWGLRAQQMRGGDTAWAVICSN